jgi:hypothetical protein
MILFLFRREDGWGGGVEYADEKRKATTGGIESHRIKGAPHSTRVSKRSQRKSIKGRKEGHRVWQNRIRIRIGDIGR